MSRLSRRARKSPMYINGRCASLKSNNFGIFDSSLPSNFCFSNMPSTTVSSLARIKACMLKASPLATLYYTTRSFHHSITLIRHPPSPQCLITFLPLLITSPHRPIPPPSLACRTSRADLLSSLAYQTPSPAQPRVPQCGRCLGSC